MQEQSGHADFRREDIHNVNKRAAYQKKRSQVCQTQQEGGVGALQMGYEMSRVTVERTKWISSYSGRMNCKLVP